MQAMQFLPVGRRCEVECTPMLQSWQPTAKPLESSQLSHTTDGHPSLLMGATQALPTDSAPVFVEYCGGWCVCNYCLSCV